MTTIQEQILNNAAARGWAVAPIWSLVRRVSRKGRADAELLSVYRDLGVVPKSSRNDNHNTESDDLSAYQYVEAGDLVLNKMKTWQGSLAVSPHAGIVSPAYFVCEVSDRVDGRYLHHLLRSTVYIAVYASLSKGIRPGQWDLPYDEFRKVPVPVPPLDVQSRIADFLDDHVARIDETVRLRREQIAALDHKRQLALSDCVSGRGQGLAMTTHPLLGEVVAEWPVTAVKRVVRRVGVGLVINPSTYVAAEGVPFLLGRNVRDGWFDFTNLNRMSSEDSRRLASSTLRSGDVVVVRAGYPGRAAVVTDDLDGANCASILILRSPTLVLPDFLAAYFNSPQGRSQVKLAQYGAAQEQINVGDVVDFQIPVPSIAEQRRLVDRQHELERTMRAATSEMSAQIDLLQERKRSLITAAVTGEFDVTTASGRGV